MANLQTQRSKLLHLAKMLLEETDEENPLSMQDILARLEKLGIEAERKSIYTDVKILRKFGIDIETTRGKTTKYFIAQRQFELPELKLLVDAVQSSRFISAKKSKELIAKLSSLTSKAQAQWLQRPVYVEGRAKSVNEQSYYSVDAIHTAINERKKVEFQYFDYNVRKRKVYRKKKAVYRVTPITLCWDSDKYYLVAYSDEHNALRNYRVDRMSNVEVSPHLADIEVQKKFDVSEHIKRAFGMFGGELVRSALVFDNSLVNVVLDYFGNSVELTPLSEEKFEVTADVLVSPVFLAWMIQFGGRAYIKSPNSLIEAAKKLIAANARLYGMMSDCLDT